MSGLRSPSSYDRVEQSLSVTEVNEGVFFLYRDITEESRRDMYRKIWERDAPVFRRYRVVVSYDAQNGFGATVRGSAVCEFYTDVGSDVKATASTVVLNGKTLQERIRATLSP